MSKDRRVDKDGRSHWWLEGYVEDRVKNGGRRTLRPAAHDNVNLSQAVDVESSLITALRRKK